jgi:hypothetical protein
LAFTVAGIIVGQLLARLPEFNKKTSNPVKSLLEVMHPCPSPNALRLSLLSSAIERPSLSLSLPPSLPLCLHQHIRTVAVE